MTAVNYNKELVVDALHLHGANVNTRNNTGDTALSRACRYENNYAVVKELIDNGADVSTINIDGMTLV